MDFWVLAWNSIVIGWINGFLAVYMTMRFIFWKPYKSKKQIAIDYKNAPRVDVFIATYNEGMEILRKTIAGCQNLNYPKDKLNIYLCDDGKRKGSLWSIQ